MMDRKSQRAAGRAAMAGHFKNVDEAMEAVNRITPILARAALADLACSFPEEVLEVVREIESEAAGPKCPNAPPFKAVFDETFVAWLAHYGSSTLILVADAFSASVKSEHRAYRDELKTGVRHPSGVEIDVMVARALGE